MQSGEEVDGYFPNIASILARAFPLLWTSLLSSLYPSLVSSWNLVSPAVCEFQYDPAIATVTANRAMNIVTQGIFAGRWSLWDWDSI